MTVLVARTVSCMLQVLTSIVRVAVEVVARWVIQPRPTPFTSNLEPGVEVFIPTLPEDFTTKAEVLEEDATLKTSLVPAVPLMLNPIVELVALKPKTVPLNKRLAVELKAVEPVK